MPDRPVNSSPLPADALYSRCPESALAFATTDELQPLDDHLGQHRAVEALRFGLDIRHDGYNMFLLGSPGVGKHQLLQEILQDNREPLATPVDWCYVNNFDEPHNPRMLVMPAGTGKSLRDKVGRAIEDLLVSIPAAFQSEEYQTRVQDMAEQYQRREHEAFRELGEKARQQNVALLQTPNGYTLAPMKDDNVLSQDDFDALPEEERTRILAEIDTLKDELKAIVRQLPQWMKEGREHMRELTREFSELVIEQVFDDLNHNYQTMPQVRDYLAALQASVVENVDAFRQREDEDGGPTMGHARASDFRQYSVNVLVDNSERVAAPVVYEDNPSFINLVGRIEHLSQFGALLTDFTMIRAGALHRANGGYLVLDAAKVLGNPFAWDALKRILTAGEIRTQSMEQMFSFASTTQLEPEPIPLTVKVILTGDRYLYYLLQQLDPEFDQLFKVAAEMSEDVALSPETIGLFARLIRTLQDRHKLLPFSRGAVARVVEQCSRHLADAEKLSLHVGYLTDLLLESDYLARQADAETVAADSVDNALAAAIYRVDQVRQRSHEQVLREIQLVDTGGERVAQVNGLAVYQLGQHAFGKPSRITATTRLGSGGVVDIEREAKLGGNIHTTGMLILSSFVASRYAAD